VMSATLIVLNPVLISTLGTEISWAVMLAWVAVASSIRKRWDAQTGALALMLCVHLDLSTLAAATLLLLAQWRERKRFPLRPSLVLAIAALGSALMCRALSSPAGLSVSLPPFSISPESNLSEWRRTVRQLLGESELYWLFLPFIGTGLLALSVAPARKVLWIGLAWGVVSVLSYGAFARAMMVTLGVFLSGLGIGQVVKWAGAGHLVCLDRLVPAASLALVAGLPLGAAQSFSLLQRYQSRPLARQALEQQAAAWLRDHSEPTSTVLSSERIGYLADRPFIPWNGSECDRAEMALLLSPLSENPPQYCVSFRSLPWSCLTWTGWFQGRYVPVQEFRSPYDATLPVTVWAYRPTPFDLGERQPMDARLPGNIDWIGYSYWPERIQPGDAVYVTLYWRATQPVTTSFKTVARISSSSSNAIWAQQDTASPHSVPADWWQPGQVIAERFVVETREDTPIGAHHLDVYVVTRESKALPIYREGSMSPLAHVSLGYVVVPLEADLEAELGEAKRVDANLDNQIGLLGFKAADRLSSGEQLLVKLYWEARQQPSDDYVVFVHLLDADGQLVGSHDGPPMDRQYPTSVWLAGEVVPDVHRFQLDAGLVKGTYWLQVGMYRWPSMERLPIWDRQGTEQTDRVLVLGSIEVQ
jgi:hypothetical protein